MFILGVCACEHSACGSQKSISSPGAEVTWAVSHRTGAGNQLESSEEQQMNP